MFAKFDTLEFHVVNLASRWGFIEEPVNAKTRGTAINSTRVMEEIEKIAAPHIIGMRSY